MSNGRVLDSKEFKMLEEIEVGEGHGIGEPGYDIRVRGYKT